MDIHAASRERDRDAARADAQLECATVTGKLGQEVDGRLHGRRIEHLVVGFVVGSRDRLAEETVVILCHRTSLVELAVKGDGQALITR